MKAFFYRRKNFIKTDTIDTGKLQKSNNTWLNPI